MPSDTIKDQPQHIALSRLKAALAQVENGHLYSEFTCMKLSEESAVISGYNGQNHLIIKHFYAPQHATIVQRLKTELDYLSAHMKDRSHQVNTCLSAHPDQGLAMLEFISGDTVAAQLMQCSGPQRYDMIATCSQWLSSYIGARHHRKLFPVAKWQAHLGGINLPEMRPEKRFIIESLLDTLTRQIAHLDDTHATFAASHGDYSSQNLIYNAPTMFGVDIQGKTVMPIAQELARFLAWQHTAYAQPAQPLQNGTFTADMQAVFTSFQSIKHSERDVFRFFMGYHVFLRLLTMRGDPTVFDRAARLMTSYLADF